MISEEVQVVLPNSQALLRMVNRQQYRNHPEIPQSSKECNFYEHYNKTLAYHYYDMIQEINMLIVL